MLKLIEYYKSAISQCFFLTHPGAEKVLPNIEAVSQNVILLVLGNL